MKGTKEKSSSKKILIRLFIWLTAACLMLLVFFTSLSPISEEVYFTTNSYQETVSLRPGDYIEQSFLASTDRMTEIAIALSYDETIPDSTTLLLKVLSGGQTIVEQPLKVKACVNQTFLPVAADIRDCQGKTITIHVENTSAPSDPGSFALLSSDKEYLYPDSMENYTYNGVTAQGRLLCKMTYVTGYTWYRALTYAFWIFLTALVLTRLAAAGPRLLYSVQVLNPVPEGVDHKQHREKDHTGTE